jgi:NhaA family Na+:H+ antiporter
VSSPRPTSPIAIVPAAVNALREFFSLESAGGIVLMLAALAAMAMDNGGLSPLYARILETPVVVAIGGFEIAKPLLYWINDGLMAVFFLLVGLEIKREMLDGQLSSRDQIVLPAAAALGGMAVPALIFAWFNAGTDAIRGWAIPSATDIAFSLGILMLLGSRVPLGLKVFLTAVAVLDDLGAIVVIALFYTEDLSLPALVAALIGLGAAFALNRMGVRRIAPYILIGIVVWASVLKSGVHATLAGVLIAMAIPIKARDGTEDSPLRQLEHGLHPWVAYMVLPIFGFANAGIQFSALSLASLVEPIPLGIALGLFVGKQLGIFGAAWLLVKGGLARLPDGATWSSMYGVAVLCGIGFTMSLFIGGLAYAAPDRAIAVRVGVLAGSLLSAIAGYLYLRAVLGRRPEMAR